MHHFSHPDHRLQEVYINEEFLCDGCHCIGHGKRYRCTVCASSFELHVRCATCPSSVALEFHAEHPLTLVNQNNKVCKYCTVCGDEVNGLYYTCKQLGCNFHVHPLCTELPARVKHALHPKHVLTLRAASGNGQCVACGDACSKELWRYQCEQCNNVDVHIECAFKQVSPPPPPPPQTATTDQKSPPTPTPTTTDFQTQAQYPPPSATWYQPPIQYPPPPAQSNQCSPPAPATYFQGQYPPSSATWYHYQQPQPPVIGWYPPPPPPQNNYWVNGYTYNYPTTYPYYYPYPYYYNTPQYPIQQHGHGQSSTSISTRRKIYSVLANIASSVAIAALTGGLLN